MIRKSVLALISVIALLAALPVGAEAQANAQERRDLERRVRQAFQNRIRQELRLTPPEMESLREVISWSEGERSRIATETRDLNGRVADFLREGGTSDDARTLLTERASLQRRGTQLFLDEQERLLEVLTPAQVVRFYRLRDEFNARILRARQGGALRPSPEDDASPDRGESFGELETTGIR